MKATNKNKLNKSRFYICSALLSAAQDITSWEKFQCTWIEINCVGDSDYFGFFQVFDTFLNIKLKYFEYV